MCGIHTYSSQVQLVLEYCSCGTLRDALDQGSFHLGGIMDYAAVLDTALDIACGMQHLHGLNVVHSDLKVWIGGGEGGEV